MAANNVYNSPPTANKVLRPMQENNVEVISFPVTGLFKCTQDSAARPSENNFKGKGKGKEVLLQA